MRRFPRWMTHRPWWCTHYHLQLFFWATLMTTWVTTLLATFVLASKD